MSWSTFFDEDTRIDASSKSSSDSSVIRTAAISLSFWKGVQCAYWGALGALAWSVAGFSTSVIMTALSAFLGGLISALPLALFSSAYAFFSGENSQDDGNNLKLNLLTACLASAIGYLFLGGGMLTVMTGTAIDYGIRACAANI